MRARTQMAALCLILLLAGGAQANDSLNVRRVGQCATPGLTWRVAVSDSVAYVTVPQNGLSIISVSDPAHPETLGHYDTPKLAMDVAVCGNYAYMAIRPACHFGFRPGESEGSRMLRYVAQHL
jgi:hypothetical protein